MVEGFYIYQQGMVAEGALNDYAAVGDFGKQKGGCDGDAFTLIFRDAVLCFAEQDVAAHFAADAGLKVSVGVEVGKSYISLGAGTHQGGTGSQPVEADDIFEVMQGQARGGFILFFDENGFAFQCEVGFRVGDVEGIC